jgi:hypothetical protein
VIDLDRAARHCVGEADSVDILAGAIVDGDGQTPIHIRDVADWCATADLTTEAAAVAVVNVRFGASRNWRGLQAIVLVVSDAEYQEKRNATRDELAQLPDGDRIRAFDTYRTRILALPDAIAEASPARLEELCRIVVELVVVADRPLKTIEWVPAARPFFKWQRECPQGDSNP